MPRSVSKLGRPVAGGRGRRAVKKALFFLSIAGVVLLAGWLLIRAPGSPEPRDDARGTPSDTDKDSPPPMNTRADDIRDPTSSQEDSETDTLRASEDSSRPLQREQASGFSLDEPDADEWALLLAEVLVNEKAQSAMPSRRSTDGADRRTRSPDGGTGKLLGSVTSDGEGLAGVRIDIQHATDERMLQRLETDERGQYYLDGVSAGEVRVEAHLPAGPDRRARWLSRIALIESGAATQVDFVVEPAEAALEGAITVRGLPPVQLTVMCWTYTGGGIEYYRVRTNPDGSYSAHDLAPGQAHVRGITWDAEGVKRTQDTEVELVAGETTVWNHDFGGDTVLTWSVDGLLAGGNKGIAVYKGAVSVPAQEDLTSEIFYELLNTMYKNLDVSETSSFRDDSFEPGEYTLVLYSLPTMGYEAAAFRDAKVAVDYVTIEEGKETHVEMTLE
jgi:hypothetical protein